MNDIDDDDSGAGEASNPRPRLQITLVIVAVIIILAGLFLVFQGMGGSSGGCFFWPIPLIILCGAGSGNVTPFLVVPLVVAFIFMLFFSWSSTRWSNA